MVISFSLENVRKHLLEHGIVYTLRDHPHKTGRDWANSGRCTEKIADVSIIEVQFKYLDKYLIHSGFETVEQWLAAYCHLNGESSLPQARLYRVEVISTSRIKEAQP
jgi:hypothetical protein